MLRKKTPIIGIIDSGMGGISVLNGLIEKLGCGDFIYFADNAYMPYGDKTKEFVLRRVKKIIDRLQNDYHVDKIFVACNTASSAAVTQSLQENVIWMKFDDTGTFLMTPTSKKNLKNSGLDIIADRGLASEIEKHIITDPTRLETIIKAHVKRHKLNQKKRLVLGCTHYELVKDYFLMWCPDTEIVSNSERVIADFCDSLVREQSLEMWSPSNSSPQRIENKEMKNQADQVSISQVNIHFVLTQQSFDYYKKLNKLVKR